MNMTEIIRYAASRLATTVAGGLAAYGVASEHAEPFIYAGTLLAVDAAFAFFRRWQERKG